jgi:uncharacterized protein YceK
MKNIMIILMICVALSFAGCKKKQPEEAAPVKEPEVTHKEEARKEGTVASSAGDMPITEDLEKLLSEKYKGKSYSPYANRDFPNELLWGDSHLHTGLSFDAGSAGAILLPEDAYRFAKGEEVESSYGIPKQTRKKRPR